MEGSEGIWGMGRTLIATIVVSIGLEKKKKDKGLKRSL